MKAKIHPRFSKEKLTTIVGPFLIGLGLVLWITGGLFSASANPHDNYFRIKWDISQMFVVAGLILAGAGAMTPARRESILNRFARPGWIAVLILSQTFLLAWGALWRHWDLHSKGFDLGIYSQAVWAVSEGLGFWSSLRNEMSLLGDHFEPILALLAPTAWWGNTPVGLLIVQSLTLGLSGFLIFRKAKSGSVILAAAITIAWLFHRGVSQSNRADFHSVSLAVPFILLLTFSLTLSPKPRYWLAIIASAFLCATKENLILTSGLLWLGTGIRKPSHWLVAISHLALFVLVIQKVIPSFTPEGQYFYIQNSARMGLTCSSVFSCAQEMLTSGTFIAQLISQWQKWQHFVLLGLPFLFFWPFAILPALSWEVFLVLIDRNAIGIQGHYTTMIVALMAAGTTIKVASLSEPKLHPQKLSTWCLVLWGVFWAGRSEMFAIRIHGTNGLPGKNITALVNAHLGPSEPVWLSSNLVPHFSSRKLVFEWPYTPRVSTLPNVVALLVNGHGVKSLNETEKMLSESGYTPKTVIEIDTNVPTTLSGAQGLLLSNFQARILIIARKIDQP